MSIGQHENVLKGPVLSACASLPRTPNNIRKEETRRTTQRSQKHCNNDHRRHAKQAREHQIAGQLNRTCELKQLTKSRLDLHILRSYEEDRRRSVKPDELAQRREYEEKDRILFQKNRERKLQMMRIMQENDDKKAAALAADMKLPKFRRLARKRMERAKKGVQFSVRASLYARAATPKSPAHT